MKAIETKYNGYRFRSRLEARWAVFFDALGIEYQYEPEGVVLDWHGNEPTDDAVAYLPDFYLPASSSYVEVKGSMDGFPAKVLEAFKYGDVLSSLLGMGGNCGPSKRIPILGDIPQPRADLFPVHLGLHTHKGQTCEDSFVFREGGSDQEAPWLQQGWWNCWHGRSLFSPSLETIPLVYCSIATARAHLNTAPVLKAYDTARMARFEHGETPCPR